MIRHARIGILLAACAALSCGSKSTTTTGGGKPKVAVSIFPIYDLTKRIAGDRLDVVLVLPPGQSEHGYEPTPKEMTALEGSKLGIAVGLEMDRWFETIMKSTGNPPVFRIGEKVPTIRIDVEPITAAEVHAHEAGHKHGHEGHDHDKKPEAAGSGSAKPAGHEGHDHHDHDKPVAPKGKPKGAVAKPPAHDHDHDHKATAKNDPIGAGNRKDRGSAAAKKDDHDHHGHDHDKKGSAAKGPDKDHDHDHDKKGSADGSAAKKPEHDHKGHKHAEVGSPDPHVWMDPNLMVGAIDALVAELSILDPGGKATFTANAETLKKALVEVDAKVTTRRKTWTKSSIVTFHGSMAYFARRYNILIAAVVEPVAGSEPTAQYIDQVVAAVKRGKAVALFTEPQLAKGPGEAIAREAGIPLGELDPVGGITGRESYEALISWNADQLEKVLK